MLNTDFYRAWWSGQGQAAGAAVPRFKACAPLIPRGGRLLDVGCGDGTFLRLVRDRVNSAVGLEVAEVWGDGRPSLAMVGDSQRMPFRSGVFDTVTCLDVIEHVFDAPQLLAEINRVLAPGGICFISTPNIRQINRVASILIRGRFPRTSEDNTFLDSGHIHFFTGRDLVALAQAAKFSTQLRYIVPDERRRALKAVLRTALPARAFGEFFAAGLLLVCRRDDEGPRHRP